MSQYKEVEIGEIVYFWFAANTTAGAAGDGATPLFDVRLAGAASDAAPTASGTPTLLSHANYSDGLHEIAIDTTGYAAGEYAVFCTLTISTVNPGGFCGSFRLKAAGASIHSATTRVLLALPAAAADAAGGLPISDAGALDLDAKLANTNEVTAARMGALTDLIDGGRLDLILDARASQASVDTVDGIVDSILADTGTDGVVVAAASKTGYALSAAGVQAVWDALTSALTTVGSIGKRLVDYLTGDVFGRLGAPTGASVSADIAAVKAQAAAIETDTQDLQAQVGTAGAGLTALASASNLATVAGYLDTEIAAILEDTAAIPSAATIAAAVGAGQPASESYAAAGALPTRDQAILAILQLLSERSIVTTTMTVKKLDGSTSAMTFTLDDATTPTAITRAT